MKKAILFVALSLSLALCSFAQLPDSSPEYAYANAVIKALGISDQAISMPADEGESLESLVPKIAEQNKMLESAKAQVKDYLKCGDLKRELGADIITKAANSQIDLNHRQLEVYRKYKHKSDEADFSDEEWNDMISMLDSVEFDSWKGIISIAAFAAFDLANLPKSRPYAGKINFKASTAQRDQLIKKIDGYFGKKIQAALDNPDHKTYNDELPLDNILLGIYRMRCFLSASTYEEFNQQRVLLWPQKKMSKK